MRPVLYDPVRVRFARSILAQPGHSEASRAEAVEIVVHARAAEMRMARRGHHLVLQDRCRAYLGSTNATA